ncbi:hypothetical protein QPX50_10735 [Corynebacterium accolens]|uniref:hypothetical protein n=1 Tax=Corynebacterium accolens TaxID=38284 RepID=UPI0025427C8C|nr:hypothetical protein [Corynebacterium accolens]MDK4331371.1 hypothetical protein [Corynebacterium accolens]
MNPSIALDETGRRFYIAGAIHIKVHLRFIFDGSEDQLGQGIGLADSVFFRCALNNLVVASSSVVYL